MLETNYKSFPISRYKSFELQIEPAKNYPLTNVNYQLSNQKGNLAFHLFY